MNLKKMESILHLLRHLKSHENGREHSKDEAIEILKLEAKK